MIIQLSTWLIFKRSYLEQITLSQIAQMSSSQPSHKHPLAWDRTQHSARDTNPKMLLRLSQTWKRQVCLESWIRNLQTTKRQRVRIRMRDHLKIWIWWTKILGNQVYLSKFTTGRVTLIREIDNQIPSLWVRSNNCFTMRWDLARKTLSAVNI